MAKKRSQVKPSDTWDLSKLYKNTEAWEEDFAAVKKLLPKISAFKGKLSSVPVVLNCFKLCDKLGRLFEKVSAYANHKADEDMGNSENGKRKNRVKELEASINESTAFIDPELLAQPDNFLPALLKLRKFADWSQEIKKLIRERPHTLPREQEELLAKFSETFSAPHDIAEALRDNDMVFPGIVVAGKKTEITNSTAGLLRRHQDRRVREATTQKFFGTYRQFRTVLCSALYAHIKRNVIEARARNYPSVMDYLVAGDNLPLSVHQTLFQIANDHLPLMHRYCKVRRQKLGVRKLHWHDLYVSLVPNIKDKFSYERAVELVLASVAPLGTAYVSTLKAGLTTERWVDRYPNKGKRSGAYSAGTYDTPPYILKNYIGNLYSVSTLGHEAGHSMHSHLAKTHQPYAKYGYSIFVAEIASTLNELLLNEYLLIGAKPMMRAFIINNMLEDIRTTFFRQTMFAEFEAWMYERVWKGEPLTPDDMEKKYFELNTKYYGPNVEIDDEIHAEWSFIPHFYFDFYVYKYATSLALSNMFVERVLHGGEQEVENYLNLLRAGGSDDPAALILKAGQDVGKPDYLVALMKKFEALLDEFQEMKIK